MLIPDNEKSTQKISSREQPPDNGQENMMTQMGDFEDDIGWLFPVSSVPTDFPKLPMQRIRLYVNGATKRLYVYNVKTAAWLYTTLT